MNDTQKTFINTTYQIQSEINLIEDGKYSVRLTDLDSGLSLPTFVIFNNLEGALDYARKLVRD